MQLANATYHIVRLRRPDNPIETRAELACGDGEAVTVPFDRVYLERVVAGRPVRDVRSRAGQRNYAPRCS